MEGVSTTAEEPVVPTRAAAVTAEVLATDANQEAIAVEVPPVAGAHHYLPALDGLRAFAVAGVIAYHLGFHWANGGYLGVDFFFVLSGFLITGLLVGEWDRRRTIALRSFWFRRAKRLLPAVMVLLLVLSLYTALGGPNITPSIFRGDAIATLFYYANWHLIFTHQSYFAQFAAPSPLRHTWSLAIEEQFYLIWPLLLLVGFGFAKRRAARSARRAHRRESDRPRRAGRPVELAVTAGLACASAAEMVLLFEHGSDLSRIYYGTDTRAFELLIGAVLAFAVTDRPEHPPAVRRTLHLAAPIAAIALGVLWVTAGDDSGNPVAWMFRGGLVLAGLLAAVVIAGVSQPDPGTFGRFLSLRPLRWIGAISYGLYLWHWPVYVLMTDVTTGLTGAGLLVARLAATLGAATISFYLVERPIRRYQWKGWPFLGVMASGAAATATAVVLGATTAVAQPGPVSHPAAPVKVVAAGAVPNPLPPPILLPAGRVPSATDPLRVMTLGDSVMWDAEPALAAALTATGTVRLTPHADPGWGLRNDTHLTADLAQAVDADHPEVILVMWSWDNGLARRQPAEFERLLGEAVDTLLAPGDGVDGIAFVQFPKIGPLDAIIDPGQRQQMLTSEAADRAAFDAIVSHWPTRDPGRITWLPVAPALEVGGRYSAWLPTVDGGWLRARKTDNTHFCAPGAAVFAAAVTSDIRPMFRLPPTAPGWLDGAWTANLSRFGPASECPDDQPPR
jgi:peptidoglycan/LPS O-acetylase OafA/YrhL